MSTETVRLIRDGEKGGGEGGDSSSYRECALVLLRLAVWNLEDRDIAEVSCLAMVLSWSFNCNL